ncbi:hypothetical protein ACK1KB_13310 [Chryseobacterium sp. TY3]
MKQILIFIIFNFYFFSFAQNLNLRNQINEGVELPQKLNKNDIAIIYEINGGWSAYDYFSYYFVDENGNVKSYSEERPKSYLKNEKLKRTIKEIQLTEEKKNRIINLLKSKELSELLKYKQEDFKIKIINEPPPCMFSDLHGYKLTLIQNKKQNSYEYYAPREIYERCNQKNINKDVLKKYIEVLNLL